MTNPEPDPRLVDPRLVDAAVYAIRAAASKRPLGSVRAQMTEVVAAVLAAQAKQEPSN